MTIKDKNLNVPDEFKNIYKIVDKLEQRISALEKSVGRIHSILVQVNAIKEKNDNN